MEKGINKRVQNIVDEMYNGNVSLFCRACGISTGTMSTILGVRKSKPSSDTIEKIISATDINSDWLLTGKGEMKFSDSGKFNLKNQNMEKKVTNIEGETSPNVPDDPRLAELLFLERQLAELKKEVRELIEENAILKYELKKLKNE